MKRWKDYQQVVVVYGGRDFGNRKVLFKKMYKFHAKYDFDFIVAGGADGVDKLAIEWAKDAGLPFKEEPADWSNLDVKPCLVKTGKYGPYNALAGLARNQSMLDKFKPKYAIQFPGGTGTEDMRKRVCIKMAFGLLDKHITVRKRDGK